MMKKCENYTEINFPVEKFRENVEKLRKFENRLKKYQNRIKV